MRQVTCPACGRKTDVSAKAMSLRCPHCTQPIQLDDFVFDRSTDGRLKTMGQVTIAPDCEMNGEVTCGQFHNAGSFHGKLLVYGPVQLTCGSRTHARVAARSFEATPGSTFAGALTVGPRVGLAPADAHPFPAPAARNIVPPHEDSVHPTPSIVILPQAEPFRAGSPLARPTPEAADSRHII